MHELGLADAMLKTVSGIIAEEGAEKVVGITITIGDLSGVVPKFMQEAWTAVIDGTPFEGVPLHIEREAGIARCMDCEEQFEVDLRRLRCPKCGSHKLLPLAGRGMTIEEIDVL